MGYPTDRDFEDARRSGGPPGCTCDHRDRAVHGGPDSYRRCLRCRKKYPAYSSMLTFVVPGVSEPIVPTGCRELDAVVDGGLPVGITYARGSHEAWTKILLRCSGNEMETYLVGELFPWENPISAVPSLRGFRLVWIRDMSNRISDISIPSVGKFVSDLKALCTERQMAVVIETDTYLARGLDLTRRTDLTLNMTRGGHIEVEKPSEAMAEEEQRPADAAGAAALTWFVYELAFDDVGGGDYRVRTIGEFASLDAWYATSPEPGRYEATPDDGPFRRKKSFVVSVH
jgi:hypothetical protein